MLWPTSSNSEFSQEKGKVFCTWLYDRAQKKIRVVIIIPSVTNRKSSFGALEINGESLD